MFFLNIAKRGKDDDSKQVHLLNTLNRIIFRGGLMENSCVVVVGLCWGIYSTIQIKYITHHNQTSV